MAAARRAAARRAAPAEAEAPTAVESAAEAEASAPAETDRASDAAEESAAVEKETVSGLAPGTLVVIESLIYAGRVYEPGQPLPSTFPADVAERRIADGSVARM